MIDLAAVFAGAAPKVAPMIAIGIGIMFLTSRRMKGRLGEWRVRREISRLPADQVTSFHDVLLPTDRGTTQIDHLVVTDAGVFVIETKTLTGLLTGRSNDRVWKQHFGRRNKAIPSPLMQNYGHVRAVEAIVGREAPVRGLVVLAGSARFGGAQPPEVIRPGELKDILMNFRARTGDGAKRRKIASLIEAYILPSNRANTKAHLAGIRARHAGQATHSNR